MSQFPAWRAKRVLKALNGLGYAEVRRKGSHRRLEANGRAPLTFAYHDGATVPPSVLRSILMRDVGLTAEEAEEVVRRG